jgi:hypothetical protein
VSTVGVVPLALLSAGLLRALRSATFRNAQQEQGNGQPGSVHLSEIIVPRFIAHKKSTGARVSLLRID